MVNARRFTLYLLLSSLLINFAISLDPDQQDKMLGLI